MVSIYNENFLGFEDMFPLEVILSLTIPVSLLAVLTTIFSTISRQRMEHEKEERELYSDKLKIAISEDVVDSPVENKDVDAIGRMLINLEAINGYYMWSQKQARTSFWLAVIMCGLGFILIIVAVFSVLWFQKGVSEAIIPMIGGVVVEVFAGTALIVYKNSLMQLNHYHRALHEDERFLSSVNLLNNFSSVESKEEMLKEIIKNEMQMNIISVKNSIKQETTSTSKGKKEN